jgi:hypothetical protein
LEINQMNELISCLVTDAASLPAKSGDFHDLSNEGYLELGARIARTGLQEYRAEELGLTDRSGETISVLRPEEEVFASRRPLEQVLS